MFKWIESIQSQDLQEIMKDDSFDASSSRSIFSNSSKFDESSGPKRSLAGRSYDETDLISSSSSDSVSFTMNNDVLQNSRTCTSWNEQEAGSYQGQSDCEDEEDEDEKEESEESDSCEWATGTST